MADLIGNWCCIHIVRHQQYENMADYWCAGKGEQHRKTRLMIFLFLIRSIDRFWNRTRRQGSDQKEIYQNGTVTDKREDAANYWSLILPARPLIWKFSVLDLKMYDEIYAVAYKILK